MRNGSLYANDGGEIVIGDNVSINSNVIIDAADSGKIFIGDNVLIGPNVVLRASDHSHARIDIPIRNQGHTGGKIEIKEDVWIGANVVVMRDTCIGEHSVIAAGGIITKDVEPYSVYGNIPARLIKKRS